MMVKIQAEIPPDPLQYGGLKKCGTDLMLVQAWHNIIRGLEDNRGSINLISVDFAKAFNRMGHQACLKAYGKQGASSDTLKLLRGRSMRIKVGNKLSQPKLIKG